MQQTGELFSINPSTHLFIVFSTIVSPSRWIIPDFPVLPTVRKRKKASEPESKPFRRRFSLFIRIRFVRYKYTIFYAQNSSSSLGRYVNPQPSRDSFQNYCFHNSHKAMDQITRIPATPINPPETGENAETNTAAGPAI